NAQRAAANISDPNLHWLGPIVNNRGMMLLAGGMVGGHARMHGPNPYAPGSSVSHWSTALTPNELMEPFYTAANHEPGMAWALLDEVGWTLCSQPGNGCNGAVVDLTPPTGPLNISNNDAQERGVFVTALKDFTMCSFGMEGDFVPGQTLTARVYAATGTTRGALLASGSATVGFDGNRMHYVPISYTLQKCKEYDITIEFQTADAWPWWDEAAMTKRPWDADGVIRVRDGELSGGAGNSALPHYQLRGSTPVTELQGNFSVSATGPTTLYHEHGAFITATKTASISKLGVRVQYSAAPGVLRAYVYDAAGNVRGNLVSEGMAAVPATAGQVITVPINAVLEEGRQYNIGFDFGTFSTRYVHTEAFPWQLSDVLRVDGVELAGVLNVATQQVPAFEIGYTEGPGLSSLDIVAPWLGTPTGSSVGGFSFGKFVQAVATQDFTGVGLYADIPAGATLVANIYNANNTPARGSLVSTGTTTATAPTGLRWHDIPVSARMVTGQYYDIEVQWSAATAFPYWENVTAQPYTAYGILKIIVGEFGGVPDPLKECARFRVYSCPVGSLTATGPTATPKFALHDAVPNPFSGTATIGYELDEAASVSVQVYDVAGRKVADVVSSKAMPKGSGQLSIDAGHLASGVYFVKMSTPAKSVTRKITIIR
ncbi:MAG TPA: T9SS type A sorting domain-containing protein, partial [Candidatus Krumholzibacteria bacterium]